MTPELRQATAIVMSEFEGRAFDYNAWQFKESK
jgi:hypothetical protein